MFKKVLVPFCAMLLVAGCGSSSKRYANGYTMKSEGDVVYFDFDSAKVREEAKQVIKTIADNARVKNLSITVEGHCDARGTTEYNLALGERRAYSVKKELVKQGVPASKVETISYGKERLAVAGMGEEIHRLNRRSVIITR